MKRIVWLLLIAVLILSSYQILKQQEVTKSLLVKLPPIKVAIYINDSSHFNKWLIPIDKEGFENGKFIKGNDTLSLESRSFFEIYFKRSSGTLSMPFKIAVAPHKDSVDQAYLLLNYKASKWEIWKNEKLFQDAEASLDSLQQIFNDPKRLYGFDIRGELVVDTSFLFMSKKIRRVEFALESERLFQRLIEEAKNRNAGYNGVRIFHFIDNDTTYRTIYAGVGVTKRIETKPDEAIQYKMMPFQRNLLVLDFEGAYKDIKQAYSALEQFKIDNRFVSMAIPFHKYLDSGFGFSEDKKVRMKVCYPVF